ncbi:MAG: TonB family protein, partial [Chitinivibrionales bacterium]|nr:TonB family protein [Chitinivibrionales bacterium]
EPAPAEEDLSDLDFLDELSASTPTEVSSPTDFPCPWYIRRVRMKVEQHWNPPFNDPDASVRVTFSIFTNGSVSDVTITKSSGDATLDNLALRAIKLAEPFPRLLCPQWPKSSLELEWIFNTVKE